MALKVLCAVFLLGCLLSLVDGHGYLIKPGSRNACYKVFPGKCVPNYNANEKNCGGRQVQINNGGKCGVCGDNYKKANPSHIYPGKYATGFKTATYTEGQTITVKVVITANHQGWFEYRIGKIGQPPITQAKLTHLLKSPGGVTRFPLKGSGSSYENQQLVLPRGLSCDHCVLQWWWKVGNSWGCDDTGCGMGHGHQETFVNCADVKILSNGGVAPTQPPVPPTQIPPPQTDAPPVPLTTQAPLPPTNFPKPPTNPPNPGGCWATGAWTGNANMDLWCVANCAGGYCPASHCKCT